MRLSDLYPTFHELKLNLNFLDDFGNVKKIYPKVLKGFSIIRYSTLL